MSALDEIRNIRIEKLKKLKELGINPYPATTQRELYLKEVAEDFESLESSKNEKWVAGRIMSLRGQGALVFVTIYDGSDNFQLLFKKDVLDEEKFTIFKDLIDIGDFIETKGSFFITKRGEKTQEVHDWNILTKSILPLPEKWQGLKDPDERFRKRYLDMLMDKEVKDLLTKKMAFWEVTRNFLKEEGFQEVETPTLEVTTGGAEATPFKTYHEDQNLPLYLRISIGELWQKRLMAGGFPKTFEIGRAYRNEGSDANHLQEFTNMEFYWAYADYEDGMEMVERMYKRIAEEVFGKTEFETRGHKFDLSKKWERIDYTETIKKETGIDILKATYEDVRKKLDELNMKYDGDTMERLVDTLWKYCRKKISGPVFLTGHPKLVSPLSKSQKENPELTERFQVIVAGAEVGNGFSELNDPMDQEERFKTQQELLDKGDKEAMMPDWEFVEMLEHGMPPTCGFGFGEMLFAFLADKPIREVQFFPLMKPRHED